MMPTRSKALRTSATAFLLQEAVWVLLLVSALSARGLAATQATPVREADASCARCHAEIYRRYLATPMANASGSAAEKLRAGAFLHKTTGVEYEISTTHGESVLKYRLPGAASSWENRPLSYFLGSGHLGTTYLYSIGDYLFESPIAWYAASQGYDMKPGLAEMRQIPPPLPMESGCMRCHMSSVQPADPGTMNRFEGSPFLHGGITCEACHGDSRQHVTTGGKAAIVNPARLDADKRDSICISCHLEGDVSVERAGHDALNYRPGDSISDYLAYYVRASANLTARGVSEVEQLSHSTCKRMSGDKMSCTSCHDPHYTPDAQHRVAFFRSKCLVCHNQPQFAVTHHPENQDCTSCHMPRAVARNILHVAWTDHRILRVPDHSTAVADSSTGDHLVPIFSPEATDRDLAMAYYQLLLEGDRSFETLAWNKLNQLGNTIADDKPALDALGNLRAERGENQIAEQTFQQVLKIDPNDLTALSNLGILRAKEGKLNEAIPLLRKAFDRNQDVPGLAMNLARVECMANEGQAAQTTLQTALIYSPNLTDLRQLESQMSACGETSGNEAK
ncbi:MAG TPA: tetratricopeptide repeat protein [Terracidiphilus sp.]|nr:tetratricopeptide repeat protein [Terracidiphilus sp.]